MNNIFFWFYLINIVVLIILFFLVKKLEKKMIKPKMNKYTFKYRLCGVLYMHTEVLEEWKTSNLGNTCYIYKEFLDEMVVLSDYLREIWKHYKGDLIEVQVYIGSSHSDWGNFVGKYLIRKEGEVIFKGPYEY